MSKTATPEEQEQTDVAIDQVREHELAEKELTFSVLSDVGNGDESWELPIPATFVIAPDGTIKLAFVDADWTHRLEPAELLKALEETATE